MEKATAQVVNTGLDSSQGASNSNNDSPSRTSADREHQYITGFKLAIVIASVTLVAFLIMLDSSIVATAIPRITTDFHSLPDVGWYGAAYMLASCSLQPLTGKFYTLFDSKWTFLTFFAVFELGSLLCGVASSSDMLVIGRAVAGMGSAGLTNGALTIIAASVPLEKRPVYLGFMMGIGQIGIILGPLIGGLLTQYTTWRWCFYINLPVGAVVAILLFLIHIPDRRVEEDNAKSTFRTIIKKLDLLGFAIFALAAIQFLLALEWGGTRYRWNSATILGLFCGAAGTFALFLTIEYRKGNAAMIPFPMVRQRIVACSCLNIFFFASSMFILTYYLPIYFQAVRDATPTMSGVYLLPSIGTQILFAMTSGYLVGKLGYYLPWSITSGILMSIGTGLLSTLTTTTSTGAWVGFQIIAGAGRGCGLQMPIVAIQNTLPREQVPIGMSLVIFSQTLGAAVALSLAQTVFTNGLINSLATSAPAVNPQSIINAGASGIRGAVSQASLPGVLDAYNKAINETFYLAAGASVATFVVAWGMGWKSVKKGKGTKPET